MKRTGFTLVEIMISAGIMSVLTAIVFFNFSSQNQKQALTQGIGTITTELQHAVANAQSGIIMDAISVPPLQYGISFTMASPLSFVSFGDTSPSITPGTMYNTAVNEPIQTFPYQKHIALTCLSTKSGLTYQKADIGYLLPSGKLSIVATQVGQAGAQTLTDEFRITLKDDRTNACQRVTLVPGVSTFTQSQLPTCSCP